MTFDLNKIMQSKREFRPRLAAKPIEEKLAMLDALRARAIALRGSRAKPGTGYAPQAQADTLRPHDGAFSL